MSHWLRLASFVIPTLTGILLGPIASSRSAEPTPADVKAAMKKASTWYRSKVAIHGGYVYFTSEDLTKRWGEGVAAPHQIWVQPPGTPTVGMAWLAAWKATGDDWYLDAARETAAALIYGQLQSGGWTNSISFEPNGKLTAAYRNGRGKGRNYSTLDDGITQSALRFLMRVDEATKFQDKSIHEATQIGLDALLAAQYANGGFPQVWSGPVPKQPVVKARYPDYDWRTENRIKEYWNCYTLNDNVVGQVADTLVAAHAVYGDEKYLKSLSRLGEFLILAQMPAPQPGWAQQYDFEMRPVWARKFEPPALSGRETEDAIAALLTVHRLTGDARILEPIPRALEWLRQSTLKDGQLARYYELKSNKPLYMTAGYELTYDDSDVPQHYGWKSKPRVERLTAAFEQAQAGRPLPTDQKKTPTTKEIAAILETLDGEGRWLTTFNGDRLVGQARMAVGARYLSSDQFSRNIELLSASLHGSQGTP
jgi:PelA/Pel-15E family pectate lyase